MLVFGTCDSSECVIVVPPSDKERRIEVVQIVDGGKTRLGFRAEREVAIHRRKVMDQIDGKGGTEK